MFFQNWYVNYSENLFSNLELSSNDLNDVNMDDLVGDVLYVSNEGNSNISVTDIKFNSVSCRIQQDLIIGINEIDVSTCSLDLRLGIVDVTLITDEDLLEKRFYLTSSSLHTITFTSFSDFISGNTNFNSFISSSVINDGGGAITINKAYVYDDMFPLNYNGVNNIQKKNGLIFFCSSYQKEVSIIDTKNTLNPNDDELINSYNPTSSPSISADNYRDAFDYELDEVNDLLYISSNDRGLYVIDRQYTSIQTDDVILKFYNSVSTPSITSNKILWMELDIDNGLLYYGGWTSSKLFILDFNNTPKDFTDDIIYSYSDSISNVEKVILDKENDALYLSTNAGGVYVINRNGTPRNNTDDIVLHYTTSSTPKFLTSDVDFISYLNDSKIYEYDWNNGYYSILDLNDTVTDMSDDKIYTSKNTLNPIWQIFNSEIYTYFFYYDNIKNYLYVAVYNDGIYVVDTKNTADVADDTLVIKYDSNSLPQSINYVTSGYSIHSFSNAYYDKEYNQIYYGDYNLGLVVLSLDNYNQQGEYLSEKLEVDDIHYNMISWNEEKDIGENISVSIQVANSSLIFNEGFENFNSADLGILYGLDCNSKEIVDGVLKISDPVNNQYCYISVNLSKTIPKDSVVSARMRVTNSANNDESMLFFEYLGISDYAIYPDSSSWSTLSFKTTADNTLLAFRPYWPSNWTSGEVLEIDWIEVEFPESHWGSWVTYTNSSWNNMTNNFTNMSWFRYKVNLETSDVSRSPKLHSISFK